MKIQGTQYSRYPERNFRAFPPSHMLLTPESQTTELELRLQGSCVPFREPQGTEKTLHLLSGFHYRQVCQGGSHMSQSCGFPDCSWDGRLNQRLPGAQKGLQRGSQGQQWEPVLMAPGQLSWTVWNEELESGLVKGRTKNRWTAPWWPLERQDLRQEPAMIQTPMCHELPELLPDHQRLRYPWTMSRSCNSNGFLYSFLSCSLTLSPCRKVQSKYLHPWEPYRAYHLLCSEIRWACGLKEITTQLNSVLNYVIYLN